MPEITIDVRTEVWLRLRNHAERDGVAVDTLVNDLLADALTAGLGESTVIGAGESTMSDLGRHAKRHPREGPA